MGRPTARFYTLNTPAPATVLKAHVALSLLPAVLVNVYPFWLVASGAANPALGLFLWLFPWLGTGAIWTVMTQVSHAQASRAGHKQSTAKPTRMPAGDWPHSPLCSWRVDEPTARRIIAALKATTITHKPQPTVPSLALTSPPPSIPTEPAPPPVPPCPILLPWQEDAQAAPHYDDHLRWQVESAVDYSVGSPLVPILTASLNLQSMHHTLPSVCGCHFHRLYPEYARICQRHGVQLKTRADLAEAWRTNVDRVFQLSSSPDEPAVWRRLGGNLAAYLAAPYVLFAAPVLMLSAAIDTAVRLPCTAA
jgi:fatty acid desaturase